MQTGTFFQWVETAQSFQLHTRVALSCGHAVVYNGVPDDAQKVMVERGAVTMRNGTTKCRECHAEFGAILADALRTLC